MWILVLLLNVEAFPELFECLPTFDVIDAECWVIMCRNISEVHWYGWETSTEKGQVSILYP
jgi:hypothetical protein